MWNKLTKKIINKRGFTLIELLAIVAILAFLLVVGTISVSSLISTSEEEGSKISESSIKNSATQYAIEFKQAEKFWFEDNVKTDIEYVCTTIGMLINKGFLKDDVLGLIIDDNKKIDKSTSIKIERNKNTKVYTEEVLFNTSTCDEPTDINISYTVSGESNAGYENWYKNDVTIEINVTNKSQIGSYNYMYNGKSKSYTETAKNKDNWKITVGEQGKNIDICMNIVDIKDREKLHCLSDNNLAYNMDKEKPSAPTLNLNKTGNYQIVANGSTDTITSNSNLTYYLSGNTETNNNKGQAVLSFSANDRFENKEIKAYAIDEAGNKSSTTIKILNIIDSIDTPIATKYYCSLNEKYYDNESYAKNNCTEEEDGEVSEITYWYCNDNPDKEYSSEDDAFEKCSYTEDDTFEGDCSPDGCYYITEYVCTVANHMWEQTGNPNKSTGHSCPSGYVKDFNCDSAPDPTPCNTPYEYDYVKVSCSYVCQGSVTIDNYSSTTYYTCSLDNNEYSNRVTAENNCWEEYEGTVTKKYYCSKTKKYYDTKEKANNACGKQCNSGTYYEGGCYSFNEK